MWSAGQKTVGINQENNGQRRLGQQQVEPPTAQILWQLTSIKFQLNAGTLEYIFVWQTLQIAQSWKIFFVYMKPVKLKMKGFICALKTLCMEDGIYSTENQI